MMARITADRLVGCLAALWVRGYAASRGGGAEHVGDAGCAVRIELERVKADAV